LAPDIDEDYVPTARELELMAGFGDGPIVEPKVIMVGGSDFKSDFADDAPYDDGYGSGGGGEAEEELNLELAKMESLGDIPDASFAGVNFDDVSRS
jgi:hypothetical protein